MIGCAQLFQVPPAGWKPDGWNPLAGGAVARAEYGPAAMLKTWQFWMVWVVYFLASSVGLTAIGESAPLVRELAGSSMLMTAGSALGVMSLFNGIGRLGWGAFSGSRRPSRGDAGHGGDRHGHVRAVAAGRAYVRPRADRHLPGGLLLRRGAGGDAFGDGGVLRASAYWGELRDCCSRRGARRDSWCRGIARR